MIGEKVPDFTLPATSGTTFQLSACRGKAVVLYFYPKDATPGCTTEGQQFRDLAAEFAALGCIVAGVSRDSIASHERFKAKHGFPFELLSDTEEYACGLFDVIKLKNLYGKQVRGIERSTFLIDKEGVLRQAWRKVKVEGHAREVLEALRQQSVTAHQ